MLGQAGQEAVILAFLAPISYICIVLLKDDVAAREDSKAALQDKSDDAQILQQELQLLQQREQQLTHS